MPLGPRITQDVRWQIGQVYLAHPDWRAKEVMVKVQAQLRQKNAHIKPNWPGLSAVQTELKKIRDRQANQTQEQKGLDGDWNTATLDKYPILPEALSVVMQLWKYCTRKNVPLTVREAKWAAQLYLVVKKRVEEVEERRKNLKLTQDDLDFIRHYIDKVPYLFPVDLEKLAQAVISDPYYKALCSYARRYARTELIYELIGEPFDASILDRLLMGLPILTSTVERILPDVADQEEYPEWGIKDGVEQIREFKKKHVIRPGFIKQSSILPQKEESHERSHRKEG